MRALSLLALVSCAVIASPAAAASQCGFAGRDFSSLTGKPLTGSDDGYDYTLNLCGNLNAFLPGSACAKIDPLASACQEENGGSQQVYDVGNFNEASPPVWSFLDKNETTIVFTMTGTTPCVLEATPKPYVTQVLLQCAEAQGDLTVSTSLFTCQQLWVVPTPLACAVPPTPPTQRCGFEGRDFSSLMNKPLVTSDGEYNYKLNLCGNADLSTQCGDQNRRTSVCQEENEYNGLVYDIGNYDLTVPPVWSFLPGSNNKTVTFTMTGSEGCWSAQGPMVWKTQVQLVCAPTQGELTVANSPDKKCMKVLTLGTPLACPPTEVVPTLPVPTRRPHPTRRHHKNLREVTRN